eukprot:27172-Eustigmatos_ZCMA.PRE.1
MTSPGSNGSAVSSASISAVQAGGGVMRPVSGYSWCSENSRLLSHSVMQSTSTQPPCCVCV